MIENILIRKQTPSEVNKWLYRYDTTSNTYILTQCAYLGKEDVEWDECTEDEKNKFEVHNEKINEEILKNEEIS